MRAARAQDWINRLRAGAGRFDNTISRIEVRGSTPLGDIEIPIATPIAVLSGPNGVGKSLLLRSIYRCLGGDADEGQTRNGIETGRIEVSGTLRGATFSSCYGSDVNAEEAIYPAAAYVDSGSFALKLSEAWSKILNLAEVLEEVSALDLDGSDLEDVQYMACRSYRFVKVYEVDIGYAAPFFEVGYGDVQYDSRSMGMGELSVLALWWSLRRADQSSILLIEEPEAYLSIVSQQHLFAVLAKYIVEKRLQTIITSHSEAFVRDAPGDALVFLYRDPAGGLLHEVKPHPSLLRTVGIEYQLQGIAYVEDEAALQFANLMVRKFDPPLSESVEFHVMGGDGNIHNILRLTQKLDSKIKFIGVYDGDIRDRLPENVKSSSVCLPGDVPIERMLQDVILSDLVTCGGALNTSELKQILAGLDGVNHHDWLPGLAAAVGLSSGEVISRIYPVWLEREGNREEAEKFSADLAAVLRS